MRRPIGYFGVWLLATTLAVGLSWLGVRSVRGAAGASQLDLLDRVTPPTESVVASPPPMTTVVPTTSPPAPQPPTLAPTTTTTSTTTTTTTTRAPKTTKSAPPESGTWVRDGDEWAYVRSFRLGGGNTAVRFADARVKVIYATPNSGYSVQVERQSSTVVVITFQHDRRYSQLRASWRTGPSAQVIEAG